jgi:hypothetical protein
MMVELIRQMAKTKTCFEITNVYLISKPVGIDHHILFVNFFLFHVNVENAESNHQMIQMQIIYDYYFLLHFVHLYLVKQAVALVVVVVVVFVVLEHYL